MPTVRNRIPRLLAAALALLVFAHAAGPVTTNDLYWHVRTGALLVLEGGVPPADVFSYTATDQRWHLHEWLTQLVFWGAWRVGDLHALRLLTGILAVLILALVARLYRRELGTGPWVVGGMLVFLLLGAGRLQARPTLFSIVFACLLVHALTADHVRCSRRWVLGTLLLTLLWVNLHSVGLLAPVLYAAFVAGEACKAWLRRRGVSAHHRATPVHVAGHLATLAGMCAVTLLTPMGAELWAFALQDKGTVMQFVVDEWAPFRLLYRDNEALSPEAYVTVLAVLALLLATYLATGVALSRSADPLRSRWLPDPTRVAMILACLAIGLCARRFHWMLCLSLCLALGWLRQMRALGPSPRIDAALRGRVAAAAAVLVQLGAGVLLYRGELRHQGRLLHQAMAAPAYYTAGSCDFFRLGGVEFLAAAGVRGNAFCHYGSGGILSYHLYPAVRVFIDSRIDLYRRAIYLDYLAVAGARPDQNAILDRHGTDLYYRHWDLPRLVDTSGWIPVYRGADGEIWLRDRERNRDNLARCAAYWAGRGVPFSAENGLGAAAPPR